MIKNLFRPAFNLDIVANVLPMEDRRLLLNSSVRLKTVVMFLGMNARRTRAFLIRLRLLGLCLVYVFATVNENFALGTSSSNNLRSDEMAYS